MPHTCQIQIFHACPISNWLCIYKFYTLEINFWLNYYYRQNYYNLLTQNDLKFNVQRTICMSKVLNSIIIDQT